ncbi:MAG: ferredoxin-thioredoxin reductase catalytic domain-containing protein [Promethearchaeati archaeon SRVP18_Atabeyarchaeia-1]
MITLEKVRQRAESDAKTNGCYLNPDAKFTNDLFEGLKKNEERYGYPSCPCRLASGVLEIDRDIVCPCFYRDPDVQEYGACYCGLYVGKEIFEKKKSLQPVPERRPQEKQARAFGVTPETAAKKKPDKKATAATAKEAPKTGMRLWYCKQCGYVCYREEPPYVCPICKAKKEMFEELPTQ